MQERFSFLTSFRDLVTEYQRKRNIIKSYSLKRLDPSSLFSYAAVAQYSSLPGVSNPRAGTGLGYGMSKAEALVKAISESLERYYSGEITYQVRASYKNLPEALHPRRFYQLRPGIYSKKNLKPFKPNTRYKWVRGEYVFSKTPCFILAEQVFYPLNYKTLGYTRTRSSNSSGVAAHSSQKRAILGALLELIERDAIVLAWYGGHKVSRIASLALSASLKKKMEHLQKRGLCIEFYDFSVDSVPVVVCMIWSKKEYPFFSSGASAAFSYGSALRKAFQEALDVHQSLHREGEKEIIIKNISSPADHARFYAKFSHNNLILKTLSITPHTRIKLSSKKVNIQKLINKFDPVVISLHQSPLLSVVRVLSEKLCPMNFGYGTEAYHHQRFVQLNLVEKTGSLPHFFP